MATLPSMRTWFPGRLSAGDMNVDARDTYQFMLHPPMAIIRKDNMEEQVLPFGGSDDQFFIKFDTVVKDSDGGWDPSGNRYVVQTAGLYQLTGVIQLKEYGGAGADIGFPRFGFQKNNENVDFVACRWTPVSAARSIGYVIGGCMSLAVGDIVRVKGVPFTVSPSVMGYDGVTYWGCQINIRWVAKL